MTGQAIHRYRLCGLIAGSAIELPELAGEAEPLAGKPDLRFDIAQVPLLEEPVRHWRTLAFDVAGTVHWRLAGYGTLRIAGGGGVTLDPEPGASEVAQRSVLLGPAQALMWAQRGRVALHATAVLHKGAALCLAGPSGSGKSAMAALLAERGLPVLADDLAVLNLVEDGVHLLPGYATLRLWDAVADAIRRAHRIAPAHASGGKWLVRIGDPLPLPAAVPIRDLVLLAPRATGFAIRRASAPELLASWKGLVHLAPAMSILGAVPMIGAHLRALLEGGLRVWRVTMPEDLAAARDACGKVLETLDQA